MGRDIGGKSFAGRDEFRLIGQCWNLSNLEEKAIFLLGLGLGQGWS